MQKFKAIMVGSIASELVGALGAIFTTAAIPTWYALLNKPVFSPPNWIFGPVWTTLYLFMGVAIGLIWVEKSPNRKKAIKLFLIQLGLNLLWSILFFGFKLIFVAFVEILILWWLIFRCIKEFKKINQTAYLLMIPYLLWVSFAAILNLSIGILNF